ncbi:unnamed protein product [Paramecium sonneborni]|uniref:Transmembrane protein n=1 Tax=Paramecium sonneborni TaxID=65129 RepID=A0A8S1MYL3_9CILI|nr:unnamed protein product [Paramecium sonneborni]
MINSTQNILIITIHIVTLLVQEQYVKSSTYKLYFDCPIIKHVDRSQKRINRILSIIGGLIKVLMFLWQIIEQTKYKIKILNIFPQPIFQFWIYQTFEILLSTTQFLSLQSETIKYANTRILLIILLAKFINQVSLNVDGQKYSKRQKQNENPEPKLIAKYFQPQDIRLKLQNIQHVKYFFEFTGQVKKKNQIIKVESQNCQLQKLTLFMSSQQSLRIGQFKVSICVLKNYIPFFGSRKIFSLQ